jgi:hypothetical protein
LTSFPGYEILEFISLMTLFFLEASLLKNATLANALADACVPMLTYPKSSARVLSYIAPTFAPSWKNPRSSLTNMCYP